MFPPLLGALLAGTCRAQVLTLQFKSDQGDPIGKGNTLSLTYDRAQGSMVIANANRRIGGVPSRISFDADDAVFSPVPNTYTTLAFDTNEMPAPLNPGFYGPAQRTPFQSAGRPGMSVSFANSGCNIITGHFTVVDMQFTPTALLSFTATFEQHCNGIVPALRGRMRYDAVPVADITVQSPAGAGLASGAALDFGPVLFNGSGTTKIITIQSTGTQDLTDLSATFDATGHPGDFALTPLAATILPHDTSTGLEVTFTPSAAGTRTAALRIASNDPDESPFIIHLAASTGTALGIWRFAHFSTVLNSGSAADLADPDHDGLVNLMEFATGNDPLVPLPFTGTMSLAGEVMQFTYARSVTALGVVQYIREFSESPAGPWSQAGGMTESILADDGIRQTVQVTAPAAFPAGKGFVRLRVTRP